MRIAPSPCPVVLLVCLAVFTASACTPRPPASDLPRITQALADAIAPGDTATWSRYTDPGFVYTDENAEVMDKASFLAQLKPLPPGLTGSIALDDFRLHELGDVVVTTYVMRETEDVEGQVLHGSYRDTDTWRGVDGQWRAVAMQVLALNHDPPAVTLTEATLDAYGGTFSRSATATVTLRRDGDHLVRVRDGRSPQELRAEAPDVFFAPGHPRERVVFARAADGTVTGFFDRREGLDLRWTRR